MQSQLCCLDNLTCCGHCSTSSCVPPQALSARLQVAGELLCHPKQLHNISSQHCQRLCMPLQDAGAAVPS